MGVYLDEKNIGRDQWESRLYESILWAVHGFQVIVSAAVYVVSD